MIANDQESERDRQERRTRANAFQQVRNAENAYARRLRAVANHIANLVREFPSIGEAGSPELPILEHLLRNYGSLLEPWAQSVAERFITEIARRDERAWAVYGRRLGLGLRQEIQNAPLGEELRQLLADQVNLITSLPIEAAQRVHELAIENIHTGGRYTELSDRIMETGQVTRSRANLIARTETARVSSTLTMLRAQHIGVTHYVWRTMKDVNVRDTHRKMDGRLVAYDDPPEIEPGRFYHAGFTFNCRCFQDPIIPEQYLPNAA